MDLFPRASFNSAASTFAAFRHRNYRLWFFGQLVSLIGTWMQRIAQGYLHYTLTGSIAYLGYVDFISGMPAWLFILFGGLIADRLSRRTLLVTPTGMPFPKPFYPQVTGDATGSASMILT